MYIVGFLRDIILGTEDGIKSEKILRNIFRFHLAVTFSKLYFDKVLRVCVCRERGVV